MLHVTRLFTRTLILSLLALLPMLAVPSAASADSFVYYFDHDNPIPPGWQYADAQGCVAKKNVWIANNYLHLRVGQVGNNPYCGARIESTRTFHPPFTLQVRAKFDLPAGLHTGVTLYGADGRQWPRDGEVDVDEMTANSPTYDHVRLWTQQASATTPTRCGDPYDQPNVSTGTWHTYGVKFTTTSATFTLDGKNIHTTTKAAMAAKGCTWPYNQAAGLRLFMTASAGGWGGSPRGSGYPAVELFDYLKLTTP